MSFIRPGNEPEWLPTASDDLYAYPSGTHVVGVPRRKIDFVEVVMQMLDQSDELTDEELENVLSAFKTRLSIDENNEVDIDIDVE